MLDESPPYPNTEPGLDSEDPHCVRDSRDILLDDSLGFDSGLFLEGDAIGTQYLGNSQAQRELTPEDNVVDEDLFWAALDIGGNDEAPDEMLFESYLGSQDVLVEDLFRSDMGVQECDQGTHEDPTKDGLNGDQVCIFSSKASDEGPVQNESSDDAIETLRSSEGNFILDDGIGTARDARILDKRFHNSCEETYYTADNLDEPALSLDAEDMAMLV